MGGFMKGALDKLKRKSSVAQFGGTPSIASDDAYSDSVPYNQPYPGPIGMNGTSVPRGMYGGGGGPSTARYGSAPTGRPNLNPIMESEPHYNSYSSAPPSGGGGGASHLRPGLSPTNPPHQYYQPPPPQTQPSYGSSTPTTPNSGTTTGTQETGYTRYSGESYGAQPPPPPSSMPNNNGPRLSKPPPPPQPSPSAIPNPQDLADPKASTAEVRRCIQLLRKLYRLKMSTWSRQRVHVAVQHKRIADRRKAEDLLRDIHQIVHDWSTMPQGNWSPQEQAEINFIFQNLSMLQPFWDEGPPESAGAGAGHGAHHGGGYRPGFR
ncbi:hypothetical protein QBC35DRAFT_274900 [Podospora australis]|uniref:Uncharacterized protein n=1 Tax=Podospora australis TaxID=1536484 RepID=A0AAN6WQ36_9PEZI|nr:hypothetical protein QBC35DRAFT_274900 [Podospora australis]